LPGNSKRQYTDTEIENMRIGFKNHLLNTKLDEEFEVFDSEWCVYSWDNGDKIEPMHPHDALILELKGKTLVNMTDKHGMRPAHLKMLERKEQMERWENV
jgi:hypothetical protein